MRANVLSAAADAVRSQAAAVAYGRVHRIAGLVMEANVPGVAIGEMVTIERAGGEVSGEVVGFRDTMALIVPLSDVKGVSAGARVRRADLGAAIPVSDALLGRVIDVFGRPLDGGAPIAAHARAMVDGGAPPVGARARITERFETGVRVIDGLLTCGRGQRVGIFAGAGVGKTVLLRQIVSQSRADVTVMGLIGERGCEVQDVLLVIDSLTRFAMALREIGLSAGEPPATKGYPPSVFAALPRLLERVAPLAGSGSITGIYTVLVEGDDLADPVADSARSLLDGHIVLSRELASRGHFPAIDVLASTSRVARQVTPRDVQQLAARARDLMAARREAEELRSLGAYVAGVSPRLDRALDVGVRLDGWARQGTDEVSDHDQACAMLGAVLGPEAP